VSCLHNFSIFDYFTNPDMNYDDSRRILLEKSDAAIDIPKANINLKNKRSFVNLLYRIRVIGDMQPYKMLDKKSNDKCMWIGGAYHARNMIRILKNNFGFVQVYEKNYIVPRKV